jgi:hypothetical protein
MQNPGHEDYVLLALVVPSPSARTLVGPSMADSEGSNHQDVFEKHENLMVKGVSDGKSKGRKDDLLRE